MDIIKILLEAAKKDKPKRPKHRKLSDEQKDSTARTAGFIAALGATPLQIALSKKLHQQFKKEEKPITRDKAVEKSRLWAKRMDVTKIEKSKDASGKTIKTKVLNPPTVSADAKLVGSPYYDPGSHNIGLNRAANKDKPIAYMKPVFAHEMGHAAHISKLGSIGRSMSVARHISSKVLPLAAGVMAADAADTPNRQERNKKLRHTAGMAAVAGYLPIHDEVRADYNVWKAMKKTVGPKIAAKSVGKRLGPALATYGIAYPGLTAASTYLAYKMAKNEHYYKNRHMKGYKAKRESGKSKVY